MKSFKQYLNEAKIEREHPSSTEIRFDSFGYLLECNVSPFNGRDYLMLPDSDADFHAHKFSLGRVEYYRDPTNEELEDLKKLRNKEIDPKKGPVVSIRQEMKKVMNNEILKAAIEFDKKVEAVLKKHGFEKHK